MFGGNASAEGCGDEAADGSTSVSGIDVVIANRLVKFEHDKKGFKVYIKKHLGL